MPSERASGATCVQKLDDSRNSAIHITYRISLRSSSLQEPRYPLLRVVSVMHVRDRRPDSSPDIKRERGGAGGARVQTQSLDFSHVWCSCVPSHSRGREERSGPGRRRESAPSRRRGASWAAARAVGRPRTGRARSAATHPTSRPQRGWERSDSRTSGCGSSLDIHNSPGLLDRCVNDPSAGSPTETLLRLLLPLNDKV